MSKFYFVRKYFESRDITIVEECWEFGTKISAKKTVLVMKLTYKGFNKVFKLPERLTQGNIVEVKRNAINHLAETVANQLINEVHVAMAGLETIVRREISHDSKIIRFVLTDGHDREEFIRRRDDFMKAPKLNTMKTIYDWHQKGKDLKLPGDVKDVAELLFNRGYIRLLEWRW